MLKPKDTQKYTYHNCNGENTYAFIYMSNCIKNARSQMETPVEKEGKSQILKMYLKLGLKSTSKAIIIPEILLKMGSAWLTHWS